MAAKDEVREMSPLRSYAPFAFMPMLAALAFLVAMRLVLLQDAVVAAGGGTAVALWQLWPLTPWMRRRYARRYASTSRRTRT